MLENGFNRHQEKLNISIWESATLRTSKILNPLGRIDGKSGVKGGFLCYTFMEHIPFIYCILALCVCVAWQTLHYWRQNVPTKIVISEIVVLAGTLFGPHEAYKS